MKRVAWTLGAIAFYVGGGYLTLPGVNRVELQHVLAAGKSLHWEGFARMSPFALGIMPILTAFWLVELAALSVPRWRKLRHGGPAGRRVLGFAVAVTALVLALIQAYFVARWLEAQSFDDSEIIHASRATFWLVVVTMTAGTMVLAWLAAAIGTRGIGNGYAVLFVAGWLLGAPAHLAFDTRLALALAIVACLAIVLIILVLASARLGRIALPASGILPITTAAGLVSIASALFTLHANIPAAVFEKLHAADHGIAIPALNVAILVPVWAYVFARPALSGATRREWQGAVVTTGLALAGLVIVAGLAQDYVPGSRGFFELGVLLPAIATVADWIDELRARRRELVPVWPLHAPLRIQDVRDKLAAGGIDCFLQARRLRQLLWFFGPWAPIMVLVPPERALEAEKILRELLE
ncbi:MAG TPA: hypothetical protein VGF94_15940 [Kofleriaceae bacterium]|jgi:hypothetical protein